MGKPVPKLSMSSVPSPGEWPWVTREAGQKIHSIPVQQCSVVFPHKACVCGGGVCLLWWPGPDICILDPECFPSRRRSQT